MEGVEILVVSLRGVNFGSLPLSYTESPPGLPLGGMLVFEERGKPEYTEKNLSEQNMALTPGPGCSKLG